MFKNNSICRICLSESKTNTPIFNVASESISLSEKVMVLANVQVKYTDRAKVGDTGFSDSGVFIASMDLYRSYSLASYVYRCSKKQFCSVRAWWRYLLQIFEDDGLPTNICCSCISQVESFYEFKKQVEDSDLILRQQMTHHNFVQVNCSHNKDINVVYIKEEIEEDLYMEECEQSWSSNMENYQSYNLEDEVSIAANDTPKAINGVKTNRRPKKNETEPKQIYISSGIRMAHFLNNSTESCQKPFNSVKKKRRTVAALTLENRIQVIDEAKKGNSQRTLAAMFKCSKTQIQHILANKEQLNLEWEENGDKNCRYTKRKRENLVNEMVWGWIQQVRSEGGAITGRMIQDKAKELAEIANVNHFAASNWWLENFRKRYKFLLKHLND